MGWNDHIMGPGYEHLREDEDMAELITVREACRKRTPLDGTDAKALEHALAITEAALAAANAHAEEAERKLCAARELLAVIYKEPQPWSGYKVDGQSYSIYAEIKAILSSSSPCRHEEEAKQLKEDIVELHRFAETHAEVEREDSKLIAKWAGEATSLRKAVNDEQGIEKLIKDNFHTKWDNPHVPPERHVYRAIRDYVFRKTSP